MTSAEHIRQFADGELTGDELAVFEAAMSQDSTLRARVEFESELRSRVVANMSSVRAPAGLAARIHDAISADDARGRVDGGSRWTRLFASPKRANLFAVAACLALASGAVLYGIFGRTIDDHAADIAPQAVSAQQLVVESAVESSKQHGWCAGSREAREARLVWRSLEEARRGLTELLGVTEKDIPIFDLSPLGFEFHGCGQCSFPGKGRAAQLSFVRPPSEAQPRGVMVSFFIVPNAGQYDGAMSRPMEVGEWYSSDNGDRRCHHKVLRTIDDRFVYFLVCCDDELLEPLGKLVSQQMRMGKGCISPGAMKDSAR